MKHIKELHRRGFLPVSIDYRLCPETPLVTGAIADVADALTWARESLPHYTSARGMAEVDTGRIAAVGWSSGGHLAMMLPSTARARGVPAPDVILAYYCPTNLEAECEDILKSGSTFIVFTNYIYRVEESDLSKVCC
jgi:acetyl esterase/lipase